MPTRRLFFTIWRKIHVLSSTLGPPGIWVQVLASVVDWLIFFFSFVFFCCSQTSLCTFSWRRWLQTMVLSIIKTEHQIPLKHIQFVSTYCIITKRINTREWRDPREYGLIYRPVVAGCTRENKTFRWLIRHIAEPFGEGCSFCPDTRCSDKNIQVHAVIMTTSSNGDVHETAYVCRMSNVFASPGSDDL